MTRNIYPCLWFNNQAKEAAAFYCSIFPDSKITMDTPMVVHWLLNGQLFMGLNGGPHFKQSKAVSFVIECKDQEEIDLYWGKLTTDGGVESECGWCKDKYGVSWQVVPQIMGELMKDTERAMRVSAAFRKMKKLDIQKLIEA